MSINPELEIYPFRRAYSTKKYLQHTNLVYNFCTPTPSSTVPVNVSQGIKI